MKPVAQHKHFQFLMRAVTFIMVMIVSGSCSKKHDYLETARPCLSQAHVIIPIGETIEIEVVGASDVHLENKSDLVDVTVIGTAVYLYGKKTGRGEITLKGDGTPLRCTFEVYDGVEPPESSSDNENEDIAGELEDDGVRFSMGKHIVRFESPGNIFASSADGKILRVTSLVTGMEVQLAAEIALTTISPGTMMDLSPDPVMMINGKKVTIRNMRVVKSTTQKIWIHGKASDGSSIWFVMEK